MINHCTPSFGQFASSLSVRMTPLPQVVASRPQTGLRQTGSKSDVQAVTLASLAPYNDNATGGPLGSPGLPGFEEPEQPEGPEGGERRGSRKRPSIVRTLIEFAVALAIALALTWAINTFLVQPFEVPTGSMETTIMTGDKLLADKVSLNWEPVQNSDIVVFADKIMPGRVLVKRVIATGGQVVDIKNGMVYVDGNPLYEPYVNGVETHPLEQHYNNMSISYPYTVPEGHLWVMGDNRENSADSRYFGTIQEDTVYGRAMMVIWPLEDIGPL
ncbi:MAG: signal peptidase I [Coriobacteriales bacterium]|jgi:signal peptidase I|nr:signal peptidase I [Coriobacteriales bacterium]